MTEQEQNKLDFFKCKVFDLIKNLFDCGDITYIGLCEAYKRGIITEGQFNTIMLGDVK
ncbi:MAG: hypothetical protein MJ250_02880 [Alphaproteobacteria bacterium]|nr:hypothetical protein [Alphaproteobacteria bacterium]